MNENNEIKWNYNMKEAPRNRDLILVSDGQNIWSVYYRDEDGERGWYCDEGYYLDEGDDVAWTYINLPDKNGDPMVMHRNTIAWNTVARMVAEMIGTDGVEDVGRKKEDGKLVHEFMINNEFVFWIIEPGFGQPVG